MGYLNIEIMPQSFSQVYIHLIFSTKERHRIFVTEEMRNRTERYMSGLMKNLECPVVRISLPVDHLHVLYLHSRKRTIADVVASLKRDTTIWIKRQSWDEVHPFVKFFCWQKGYGAFSVSRSSVSQAKEYIDNQPIHHQIGHFSRELLSFLKVHDLPYNEQHIWD